MGFVDGWTEGELVLVIFVGWVLGEMDNELLLGGRDDGVAERMGDFEG